jgi:hypothetical protein
MTFELEMALDVLNGQIDRGIEFPEAISRVLKIYPVSQDELIAAYDNQYEREYRRLCSLIGGKPPYGDCQLVALMIGKVISGSQIVKGIVLVDYPQELLHQDREIEHFWVVLREIDIDPLSEDWTGNPRILSREIVRTVEPSEILDEYKDFIKEFPEPDKLGLFPLRWQVKNELI